MGGLEQGFELGDEVKWVGYLGCFFWWDNHFEMALYFCLGVAERTYTWREDWMSGLEQGFELGDEVKWVGYLGCFFWWDNHFEMALYFCLGVAERTYTWREDWMGGLEQGFELGDDTEWVGYLGCLEWWDIHFEMALWKCLGVAERTYTVRQHSECGLEQGFEITHDVKWVGWLGRHNLVKHSFWDGFVLLGGESLRGDGLCAATKQSLGCGRPSEASRDPRVWKATLWIPYGIPCGYHVEYPMGYIVET